MMRAADRNNPRVSEIVDECRAAVGAAEWDGWDHRDEMTTYVLELTHEALGERSWGQAKLRARATLKAEAELRRAIAERKDLE